MMYRRRKVSVDQISSTFGCLWASHSPCLCQLLAVATESKPRHFRDSMDISELSAATVGGNYQSKFCNNTNSSPFGTKNVAFMGSSSMLADILLLNTRIVRLIRDLGNWLIACYTSQCITTHRAETRQCGRVITHSWIIGHIGGDTRSLSYSVAQVFSFSAVCVEFLNCVACPANVEKFGGRAVFLRVEHIGTGVEVSINVNYVSNRAEHTIRGRI
jgi:hypothetical protein